MPKISILMPVWIDIPDKIVWFMEALNSVRMQTEQDWEVIIIDDFSPLELSEPKWTYQDETRFRWFRTSHNQGPSLCRNTAAGLAESEALLPLDSDDMLGDENTLAVMYAAWEQDKSRIVYGDLQRLVIKGSNFEREKKFILGEYNFNNAMKLDGIMPVTTLHSRACHEHAGGWKSELEAGLEDVEYIIAAGKAGFCGHKIPYMVLLYRQHTESRAYKLKHGTRGNDRDSREGEMREKITKLHADIYQGEFPVACCGQSTNTSYAQSAPVVHQGQITTLDGYSKSEKRWVEYIGLRGAGFKISGSKTHTNYYVKGTGHKFEVHKDDVEKIKRLERGAFKETSDPTRESESQPEPQPTNQNTFNPPLLELAVVQRLDGVAAKSRGLDLPEAPAKETILMQPTTLVREPVDSSPDLNFGLESPVTPQVTQPVTKNPQVFISDLNLGNVGDILMIEGWTVERLANVSLNSQDGFDLLAIKGVREKRANQIIEKAKALLATA